MWKLPAKIRAKEDVINYYDIQIDIFLSKGGKLVNCKAHYRKQLFIEMLTLTLDDWRAIRKGDYFNERDSYNGIEQQAFILYKIREYKRKHNK